MNDSPPQSKRRIRFSILNMLLLTAIVALSITVAMQWREVGPLREEVRRHCDELGIFNVGDTKRIHAIRVPTEDDEPRKYRIYLPPGRKYTINYKANHIPSEGISEFADPHEIESGGYLIDVKIKRYRDRKTGEPMRTANADLKIVPTDGQKFSKAGISVGICESQNDWIINKETGKMSYSFQEIGRELKTFEADKPLVLYRARAHTVVVQSRRDDGKPSSWTSKAIEGECDGFMVWIKALPEE